MTTAPARLEVLRMDKEWYAHPLMFRIERDGQVLEQDVLYSQATLVKMLADHGADFHSVLDIGSHFGNVSNVFRFLGKRAVGCEITYDFPTDYKGNFIDIRFPEQFDAIWCSQVLEHQRNVGFFLNKIFDDLKDDGILALTVPLQTDMNLSFGHCNLFSPLMLMYQLVLAGFCCRDIKLKIYEWNIGIILRKRYNGIRRDLPMGLLPLTDKVSGTFTLQGRTMNVRDMLGDEIFEGMAAAFPPEIPIDHTTMWPQFDAINWPESLELNRPMDIRC